MQEEGLHFITRDNHNAKGLYGGGERSLNKQQH